MNEGGGGGGGPFSGNSVHVCALPLLGIEHVTLSILASCSGLMLETI